MRPETDHVLPLDLNQKNSTIQEQEEQKMTRHASPLRTFRTCILIFFGIFTLLYQFSPLVRTTSNSIFSSLKTTFIDSQVDLLGDLCTPDIGRGLCCHLRFEAEPCIDECRKNFMDRQTFRTTAHFDGCATGCLYAYEETCGKRRRAYLREHTTSRSG